MQCTYEDDAVALPQFIAHVAFQFPVTVIDEHKNPRSDVIILHKQLLALHDHVRANVLDKRTDRGRTVFTMHDDVVRLCMRRCQQQFRAAPTCEPFVRTRILLSHARPVWPS